MDRSKLGYTVVFEKNWEALTELVPNRLDTDGTPLRRYKYILNRGSSRSSKTHSIIQVLWMYAWENPGSRLAVFRQTKQSTRTTVFKDMKKVYPNMIGYHAVTLNKTELIWEFPNGSTIEINGTDEVDKIMGFNSEIIWLNEPYQLDEEVYNELDQRATIAVIIDINPKGKHWSDKLMGNPSCKFIHSKFTDNPWVPPAQKRKILGYQPLSMCEVVMKELIGELDALGYDLIENKLNFSKKQLRELSRCLENERNKTANKWRWTVMGLGEKADNPHRIFFWEEISDYDYQKIEGPTYYGVDWGVVDPWAVAEIKYRDGCLFIRQINHLSENDIRMMMTMEERAAVQASEEGLVPYMFNKWGIPKTADVICDSNRPMKIITLRNHGWDYAIATHKYDGSILEGIQILQDLQVFYTASSPDVMLEQETYSRRVDRMGNVDEEPIDAFNHQIDLCRYVAMRLKIQGIIKV